jgi:hypothetical protein
VSVKLKISSGKIMPEFTLVALGGSICDGNVAKPAVALRDDGKSKAWKLLSQAWEEAWFSKLHSATLSDWKAFEV